MAYTLVSGYGQSNGNWQFIASPLAESINPTEIDNMLPTTGAYDLYRFDQSESAEWQNYKANNFTLANGQGYLYANQEDVNLIFKGTFNEGSSQEVSLTYDGTAHFAGWNLVGNPFPYPATVSRSYYVMNTGGTAIEPVALSAGGTIAACTGVMVKAEASETNPSVTFEQPTRQTLENKGLLHIALSQVVEKGGVSTGSTTAIDKAIVSFNAGDALEKYVFNKDNAQISIPQNGKDYAIAVAGRDAKFCVSTTDEIPINFKAAKNGTYTLTFDTQNLDLDYLHLIDNLTGADIDLLTPAGRPPFKGGRGDSKDPRQAEYTFTAKTTDYASRFRLVFSTPADETSATDQPFAYHADSEIRLVETCHGASLQVVDVMGRVIVSMGGHTRCVPTMGMAPGVYVLRLIDGDNVRTQKIVIR